MAFGSTVKLRVTAADETPSWSTARAAIVCEPPASEATGHDQLPLGLNDWHSTLPPSYTLTVVLGTVLPEKVTASPERQCDASSARGVAMLGACGGMSRVSSKVATAAGPGLNAWSV